MEVTPIGWVCIVAGVVSLLRPRQLSALLAAGATFSATAVVNFPGVPFGMQPYHWFGALLVMNVGFLQPPRPQVLRGAAYRSVRWLVAFIGWGVVSMVSAGTYGQSAIHLAHVCFGVAVVTCIPAAIRDLEDVVTIARAAVAGATAAALWGMVQVALFVAGVEYPAHLFNNSVGESAGGYVSTVASGLIPRVSSVATEPSFLVRSLLPCLVIVIIWSQAKVGSGSDSSRSFSKDWRAWALLSATVLSTSATGFVGLGLLLVGVIAFLPSHRWKLLGMLLSLTAVAAFATWNSPELRVGLIGELLIDKSELGSGAQRASSVEEAWGQFLASPMVGTGPGVVTSDDLVVKLLANYGLVGAALFLSALGSVLIGGIAAARHRASSREHSVLVALLGANGLLWSMDLVAGLSYTYGIFWVLWALLAAATGAFEQQEAAPTLVAESLGNAETPSQILR